VTSHLPEVHRISEIRRLDLPAAAKVGYLTRRLRGALSTAIAVIFLTLLTHPNSVLAAWTQATGTSGIRFGSLSKVGTTLYAGAITPTGLYQSTDDGATWSPAFGGYFSSWSPQVVTQIGSVLYVGGTVGYTAAHLAYSTNGGSTWTDLTAWGGATNITDVVLMNGATFVATYGGGIYKSTTNDGSGWYLSNSGMTSQTYIKRFAQLGSDIFVADATNNGSDGVYKSSDNGANWSRLAASPSGNGGAVSGLINSDPGRRVAADGRFSGQPEQFIRLREEQRHPLSDADFRHFPADLHRWHDLDAPGRFRDFRPVSSAWHGGHWRKAVDEFRQWHLAGD